MRNFDCLNILGEKWKVDYRNEPLDGTGGTHEPVWAQVSYKNKIIRVYKRQDSIMLLDSFIHEILHIIVWKNNLYEFKEKETELGFKLYYYWKFKKEHPMKSLILALAYKSLRHLWNLLISNEFFYHIFIEQRIEKTAQSLSKILWENGFINPRFK